MKSLLSLLYTVRGLAVLIFLFTPKTPAVVLIFAAVMGITFLSTVPPTAGLVAKMFGTANMAMLFGIVMLSHQVGGFLGAYLGGSVFQATGSYDWVWYIDIVLALGAALVNLPIREARPGPARRHRRLNPTPPSKKAIDMTQSPASHASTTTKPRSTWKTWRWATSSPAANTPWTRRRSPAFAAQFDPQPFHLDDAAARDTLFGGLAASGWHTAAVTMRLQVTSGLPIAGGIIGAGGELTWPRPTRATDVLHVVSEVVQIQPSQVQARPGHGHRAQRNAQPARRCAAGGHRAHRRATQACAGGAGA